MFYAIELWDKIDTTTGSSAARTGKLSIACTPKAFMSAKERDYFVESGDDKRIAVKLNKLRKFFAGKSKDEFDKMVDSICLEADQ